MHHTIINNLLQMQCILIDKYLGSINGANFLIKLLPIIAWQLGSIHLSRIQSLPFSLKKASQHCLQQKCFPHGELTS